MHNVFVKVFTSVGTLRVETNFSKYTLVKLVGSDYCFLLPPRLILNIISTVHSKNGLLLIALVRERMRFLDKVAIVS